MEEEDKVVAKEADSAKANTIKGSPTTTTFTISKKPQTREVEPRVEEGAIMTNLANITTMFSMDIVANSATMRQSVERRKVRQHSQVNSSLIMPRIQL